MKCQTAADGEPTTAGYEVVGAVAVVAAFVLFFALCCLSASKQPARKEQVLHRPIEEIVTGVLCSSIPPGPFSWYITEQHNTLLRLGRYMNIFEARQRIDALCRQQREAAEQAHRNQMAAMATLAFISMSEQLRTIERNQRHGR